MHARIREEIFQGSLAPGQRLRLVEPAQRFAVSQSVIREALTRLSEQGLVKAVPQQGFSVVTISLRDLDELTEARTEVETMVLRRSMERGDLRWEASVVDAVLRRDADAATALLARHIDRTSQALRTVIAKDPATAE